MKNIKLAAASNAKLCPPSDFSDKSRKAIAEVINPLIADAFALFVKTKNFHWHLSGKHYRDYHLLFDEQAEQIFTMVDVLAERMRKIGNRTIHSIGQINDLKTIKDDNEEFVDAKEMIVRLMKDNKAFSAKIFAAHKVCGEHHDIATTSILENFMDETERRTWFLFEIQAE